MTQGRLVAIARRARSHAPMEELAEALVGLDSGVEGDSRGKPGRRQIVVMRREDWEAAEEELGTALPWTTRRANLLVEAVDLPRRAGDRIAIGAVRLEITGECDPCSRMDGQHQGLRAALMPDWRGGVTARVIAPGRIAIDDVVRIETI